MASEKDLLARYLDELKVYAVPDAAREVALAKRIEALEIAHWRALLGHALALPAIRAALAPHMREPKELAALRKLAAGKAPHKGARWDGAVASAATALRRRDLKREALVDAHQAARAACAGKPGTARYLERAEKARRAQQEAKNEFMQANLRLVVSLARRYDQRLMPLADLIQEGNLGLMRAVERFDYRKGFRFSTYASWWIRHGFNRALSDRGRLVRIPVHVLDDAQRVAKQRGALVSATGQLPSASELAKKTGLSEEKLAFIAEHVAQRAPSSLDRPLGEDGDTSLLDILPAPSDHPPDEAIDSARWSRGIDSLLGVLSPIEATIVRLRFGLDHGEELTLAEIGAKYNLSRERIRQLQVQALEKLRARLDAKDAA